MNKKLEFDYYYGTEAEQFSFIRIPTVLVRNPYFKELSNDAKLLYGLMLDRMSLSMKNHWFDEENRAYICYSIENIMESLNCGKNKAIRLLKDLDTETGIGLIEKKKRCNCKANIIYVKSFMKVLNQDDNEISIPQGGDNEFENQTSKICGTDESPKSKPEVCENSDFESPILGTNQCPKEDTNNTKYINTKYNNTQSNHIISTEDSSELKDNDTVTEYENLVKENIDYDTLMFDYKYDRELIQGLYDLILEVLLTEEKTIRVAGGIKSSELVKGRFMRLRMNHIQYVVECLKKNTTKVNNVKAYMLTALFNAPATINEYYNAKVNNEMYGETN